MVSETDISISLSLSKINVWYKCCPLKNLMSLDG